MYRRYLPTLTLKKQQLQSEIRTIEAKAIAVRQEKQAMEEGFGAWIAVFAEEAAFPPIGSSTILITHDLGVIAQNCDRVVVMYGGRVVERAEVKELFANPCHAYTKALLASMPRAEYPRKTHLPYIPGSVAAIHEFVPGCRFCQRLGRTGDTLIDRPRLVEVAPNHFVEDCPLCNESKK